MSEGTPMPDSAPSQDKKIQSELFTNGEVERILLAKQEDITLLCDPLTTILYCSPSSKAVLGYDQDEVVGKSFADFVHPEDLPSLVDDWVQFQSGHNTDPINFRTRNKKGAWIWSEARASLIEDDRFPGCSCINIHEVGHQYRLRQRVAAAEQMAKIGTWRWIIEDGDPTWSESHYAMLGYEPGDGHVDLEWALQLYHPDDRERVGKLVVECLVDPSPYTTIARMRDVNGDYRSIVQHCFTETDTNGKVVAMVGICQDITGQTQAEEALRKSENNYRLLAETSTDVIVKYDRDGLCTFISPAGESILGYTQEESIGAPMLACIYKPDRKIITDALEAARRGRTSDRITYRTHKKGGELLWMETSVRTLLDERGEILETVAFSRDITERHNVQEELLAARKKAEAANRTKSRFLANMSHELRTPLNAIIGFSDIMCESMFGPLGAPQYDEYSKLIRESGQFLLTLINDILDMSKIEAGKYELYLEEIDLEDLLEGCIRFVEPHAAKNDIEINYEIDETLSPLYADERTIKQVFLNLLSNSIKFSPNKGEISISIGQTDTHVEIRVQDTGCGIPEADISRLAQPFEQVNAEASAAQTGTGLGLALVKSFVTLHGGAMNIQSEQGEGTCVTFTLPFNPLAVSDEADLQAIFRI